MLFFNQMDAKSVHTGEMLQWTCSQITAGCNIVWYESTHGTTAVAWAATSSFLWVWLPHPCFHVWAGTGIQGSDRDFQRIWDSPLWHYDATPAGQFVGPSTQVDESKTYPLISSIARRWTAGQGLCSSLRGGFSGANAIRQSQPAHKILTGCQGIYCQVWKRKTFQYPIMASPQPYNLLRTGL